MRTLLVVVLALLLSGCTGAAAPPGPAGVDAGTGSDAGTSSELDQYVLARMQTARIPGLAAVAVKTDHTVFSGAWGEADVSAHRPVTTNTLFMLASVSKTVTAVALMQLYELAKLKLDDPIDAVLGYQARNPKFPDVAITYRMLLSHTSSIEDGVHSFDYYVTDMDSPISLRALYDGYLEPGGAYYDASNWNATSAPGTHYSYSNLALSLAGLLVEKISGMSLQDYCQQHIFAPLGMNESSYLLEGPRPHPYRDALLGRYERQLRAGGILLLSRLSRRTATHEREPAGALSHGVHPIRPIRRRPDPHQSDGRGDAQAAALVAGGAAVGVRDHRRQAS